VLIAIQYIQTGEQMVEKLNVLTLDVETTHKTKGSGGTTALPYFNNRLVSIGYKWLGEDEVGYDFVYHSDERASVKDSWFADMQATLDKTDVLVGQNLKFDLTWVRACGFKYDGHVYDTMVAEYILAKARRWSLSLDSLAKRYGVTQKEKDLVAPYLKDGKTFYDIPYDIVKEYGIADVIATEEVAVKQLEAFGTTFGELFNDISTDTKAFA
jgi:DNA polymerase I-like protein with 3'-5' exonuclease and polymerase domains